MHHNIKYYLIPERLEAEVSAAVNTHTPIRTVMASPAARSSKRARQDTGGYRAEKWSEHLEAEVSAAVRSFADEEPGVRPAKRQRQPTGEYIGLCVCVCMFVLC